MENLIKPSQYAKECGISRQAVYAKIKKGTIHSKEVNGQIYIDLNSDNMSPNAQAEEIEPIEQIKANSFHAEHQTVLASKNETIEILKSRINDLKESNEQITSVLRGEIDLLKQAFTEMRSIYSSKLLSSQHQLALSEERLNNKTEEVAPLEDYKQWVTVVRYLSKYSINPKYYASIMDYVDKIYEDGDDRTRLINHEVRLNSNKVDLEFAKEALS